LGNPEKYSKEREMDSGERERETRRGEQKEIH